MAHGVSLLFNNSIVCPSIILFFGCDAVVYSKWSQKIQCQTLSRVNDLQPVTSSCRMVPHNRRMSVCPKFLRRFTIIRTPKIKELGKHVVIILGWDRWPHQSETTILDIPPLVTVGMCLSFGQMTGQWTFIEHKPREKWCTWIWTETKNILTYTN